jgi:hypothetical protein
MNFGSFFLLYMHIIIIGPECRLRIILDELLGPTYSPLPIKKSKLDDTILVCTYCKRYITQMGYL